MRTQLLGLMVVATAASVVPTLARADEAAPSGKRLTAPLLASPIVRNFNRIALLVEGERTEPALAARAAVATALRDAGHDVEIVEDPLPAPGERSRLSKIATTHASAAVATVGISTDDYPRLSLTLYNQAGYAVFELGADVTLAPAAPPPVAPFSPPPVPLSVNPLLIEGIGFYEAVGRPDLAARYRSADSAKTVSRVVGGASVIVGVLWGILDLLATAADNTLGYLGCGSASSSTPCAAASPSPLPWGLALLGVGALVIPSFISSDPLTYDQKRALIYSGRAGVELHLGAGVAPGPNGGSAFVVGRF